MGYDWRFEAIWPYGTALVHGTITTVYLTGAVITCGTLLGLALALARISRGSILRSLAAILIELVRATPPLILLVWIYYCLPILSGWRLTPFSSALIGLSLNLSAFSAETFRSGIVAIPRGQTEVARLLGMTERSIFLRIVAPQAFALILPSLVGLYVTVLKLSSLAAVIALSEILHAGNDIISQTYRPLEVYTVVAMIYIALILPLTFLASRLERRLSQRTRRADEQ